MMMKYKEEILEIINDDNHELYYLFPDIDEKIDQKKNPDRRYYCNEIDFDWKKNKIIWETDNEYYHPTETLDAIIDNSEIDEENGYIKIVFYSEDKDAYKKYKSEMEKILFQNCKIILENDRKNVQRWGKHFNSSFKSYIREEKLKRIIENK